MRQRLTGHDVLAAFLQVALDHQAGDARIARGDLLRHLGRHATRLVSVQPNAGLPQNVDGRAVYHLTPAELAKAQHRFASEFGVSLVGGCCGTTPAHITALAEAVKGLVPGPRPATFTPQLASLYGAVPLDQDSGPLLVGVPHPENEAFDALRRAFERADAPLVLRPDIEAVAAGTAPKA